MPTARLQLYLLGPFRLLQGDEPVAGFDQARLQHLLAYLVLHRHTPVSRQQLAYIFWPDTPDQQARKNLRTLLTRLRQALPHADDYLAATGQTLQWRADAPLLLDVAEFETAVAQAEGADRVGTARALAAAVAAYAGELLPDCYDDWILPLRERLHGRYGAALERLVLTLEAQRAYSGALPYAQYLLQHDPLNEAAYRHLMRLHLALGQRADAHRVYHACAAMLEQEFGTKPARATQDLYEQLLSTETAPAPATAGRGPDEQPAAPPLIGREQAWARLLAAWQAAAAGRPQMVLLTGEAGIGKTRLAEELLAWGARQGAITAAARCYPGGDALAYAPVAELLSAARLRPRLRALNDARRIEVSRLLPALLVERPDLQQNPAGPLTEAWQRTRLFEALAHAALGAAPSLTPLLVFLDDLQWSDRGTLDWLVYLLHFDPAARLLVVGTARQTELGAEHPLTTVSLALTRAGLLSELILTPLTAAETTALAAQVAGRDIAGDEAAQIYRNTEGNPLFVVEMVRAGMGREETGKQADKETGRDAEDGPAASPLSSTSVPLAALPPKVRAVIQWRLTLLSPVAQAVAQTAAVIGRKFNFDVLARSSEQDEAAVGAGLDELWHRQLVRTPDGAAYDFSHEGIRAVAYAGIGPIRRRAIHLRVAQALEALHDADLDAFSDQIAVHYEQAGQAQPAIRFYRRAAATAQRLYAHAEAIRLYTYLLEGEISANLSASERCAVRLALAEVCRLIGYWARAQAINRQALAAAEELGDARVLAQAQRALADTLHRLGYYDEALEWLAKAEEGFRALGEWRGVVSALWTAGQIYWFRGNYPQALAVLERQLQIATEIEDESGICEALETKGMVLWSLGDWDPAADCCLQAFRIAEALGYKTILTRASITLGNVRSAQHWFGEAVHWYLRAGVLAQEIDDRQAVSWATSNIALLLAKRGDILRASTGYERSLRNATEIGDRWTACLNVAGLAAVYERGGRLDLAESLYRKAIDFGQRLGIPGYLSGMLVGLARLLLARGRATEAADFFNEAWAKISSVAGERLAGEDTRFDARVLGVRLRQALGESTAAEAAAEFCDRLRDESAPHRQAALNYELWRLTSDEGARSAAASFYRAEYAETGAEECRSRYEELTGEALLAPPLLPDVSELIPDQPEGLDLAHTLAELENAFD